MNHRILTSLALGVTLTCTISAVTACSGSDSSGSSSAPTTAASTSSDASEPAALPTDNGVPAATQAAPSTQDQLPATGQAFDICATVPTLDVISTVLTEPATSITDLGRGPGEEKCEATTDGGVDNVQFGRLTPADRAQIDELAAQLGYPVSDLNDPTLPGAYTYAGVVAVIVDGTEWSVQVITFDTITDPTSPAAIERSAALLRAWLPLLGPT